MRSIKSLNGDDLCPVNYILAVNDALNVTSGKWKIPIIGSLLFGKRRFNEIEKIIPKITPRMLSKELKELEINGIIKRTLHDSEPPIIEYELTESGISFSEVIDKMIEWGIKHRELTLKT
ncbi:MAG: helix-turn-helix domain-containing protein [Bacteroidales bacterium]